MANRLPLTDETGEVRELTAEDLKHFRPASEVLPEIMGAALATEMLRPKKIGRPMSETPKQPIRIRLDADVLAAFKAGGRGWQTRINAALKEWVDAHPV